MALEGMTVKQTMKLKILELSNGPIHSNVAGSSVSEEKNVSSVWGGMLKA